MRRLSDFCAEGAMAMLFIIGLGLFLFAAALEKLFYSNTTPPPPPVKTPEELAQEAKEKEESRQKMWNNLYRKKAKMSWDSSVFFMFCAARGGYASYSDPVLSPLELANIGGSYLEHDGVTRHTLPFYREALTALHMTHCEFVIWMYNTYVDFDRYMQCLQNERQIQCVDGRYYCVYKRSLTYRDRLLYPGIEQDEAKESFAVPLIKTQKAEQGFQITGERGELLSFEEAYVFRAERTPEELLEQYSEETVLRAFLGENWQERLYGKVDPLP